MRSLFHSIAAKWFLTHCWVSLETRIGARVLPCGEELPEGSDTTLTVAYSTPIWRWLWEQGPALQISLRGGRSERHSLEPGKLGGRRQIAVPAPRCDFRLKITSLGIPLRELKAVVRSPVDMLSSSRWEGETSSFEILHPDGRKQSISESVEHPVSLPFWRHSSTRITFQLQRRGKTASLLAAIWKEEASPSPIRARLRSDGGGSTHDLGLAVIATEREGHSLKVSMPGDMEPGRWSLELVAPDQEAPFASVQFEALDQDSYHQRIQERLARRLVQEGNLDRVKAGARIRVDGRSFLAPLTPEEISEPEERFTLPLDCVDEMLFTGDIGLGDAPSDDIGEVTMLRGEATFQVLCESAEDGTSWERVGGGAYSVFREDSGSGSTPIFRLSGRLSAGDHGIPRQPGLRSARLSLTLEGHPLVSWSFLLSSKDEIRSALLERLLRECDFSVDWVLYPCGDCENDRPHRIRDQEPPMDGTIQPTFHVSLPDSTLAELPPWLGNTEISLDATAVAGLVCEGGARPRESTRGTLRMGLSRGRHDPSTMRRLWSFSLPAFPSPNPGRSESLALLAVLGGTRRLERRVTIHHQEDLREALLSSFCGPLQSAATIGLEVTDALGRTTESRSILWNDQEAKISVTLNPASAWPEGLDERIALPLILTLGGKGVATKRFEVSAEIRGGALTRIRTPPIGNEIWSTSTTAPGSVCVELGTTCGKRILRRRFRIVTLRDTVSCLSSCRLSLTPSRPGVAPDPIAPGRIPSSLASEMATPILSLEARNRRERSLCIPVTIVCHDSHSGIAWSGRFMQPVAAAPRRQRIPERSLPSLILPSASGDGERSLTWHVFAGSPDVGNRIGLFRFAISKISICNPDGTLKSEFATHIPEGTENYGHLFR